MRVFLPTCHVITGGWPANSRGTSKRWLCCLYANAHWHSKLLPFHVMLAMIEKQLKICKNQVKAGQYHSFSLYFNSIVIPPPFNLFPLHFSFPSRHSKSSVVINGPQMNEYKIVHLSGLDSYLKACSHAIFKCSHCDPHINRHMQAHAHLYTNTHTQPLPWFSSGWSELRI